MSASSGRRRVHRRNLKHTDDHPVQRVEGVLVHVHEAGIEEQRLQDVHVDERLEPRHEVVGAGRQCTDELRKASMDGGDQQTGLALAQAPLGDMTGARS
jgi:hypothetical protein